MATFSVEHDSTCSKLEAIQEQFDWIVQRASTTPLGLTATRLQALANDLSELGCQLEEVAQSLPAEDRSAVSLVCFNRTGAKG